MSAPKPSLQEFEALSRIHNVVPVWREVLVDLITPVAAFLRLQAGPHSFLLESVEGGENWARYSFLGGDAFATVSAYEGKLTVTGSPPLLPETDEGPLAYVRRLLEAFDAPDLPGLPPLHGGAVGFMGYDCVRELEALPDAPEDDLRLPDMALLLTRTFVVFDHLLQKAFVITNVATGIAEEGSGGAHESYDEAVARCDAVIEKLQTPFSEPPMELGLADEITFESSLSDEEYGSRVERAKEYILSGDVFQVVPSRRFVAPLEGSAFGAYRALRTLNPSPYMYFLRFGELGGAPGFEIAGSSPEPLIRVTGDKIVSRPIAGTRRRGVTPEEDQALEEELLGDEKERAEHVMLVDLARNDVGRVATYGSVDVEELMIIERYSHVMHIVSSVTGRLAPGNSSFDALCASFPAGTVSGAPKVRAMEVIDELEVLKRGPYAGVVGYFDFSGNLDTCITIRTIVATGGNAYVQAGAGVVADSEPAAEAEETRRKAEALLRAVAAGAALS